MITTNSKIIYKVTAYEVKVEIPGNADLFEEDDAVLETAFAMELSTFPLEGIKVKPTTTVSYELNGFAQYYQATNSWSRQYTIKVIEPVK